MDKRPTASERATLSPLRVPHQELLARSGAALQEQRAETTRLLAGLRETYQEARRRHDEEVETLRGEAEDCRRRLTDCERERDEALERCRAADAQVEQFERAHHEVLAQAEAALQEQREELVRVLADLRDLGAAAPLADSLRPNDDAVRQRLAERERECDEALQRATTAEEHLNQCEQELDTARQRAETAEEQARLVGKLEEELAGLRRQTREQETQNCLRRTQELRPSSTPDNGDVAAYEAELVQYHRQLEADRQALNEEIEQLRTHNAELNDSVRKIRQELEQERDDLRGKKRLDKAFTDLGERDRQRAKDKKDGKLVPRLRLQDRPAETPAATGS